MIWIWLVCICCSTSFLFGMPFGEHQSSLQGNLIHGDIMIRKTEKDPRHGPLVDMRESRWPSGIVPYELNRTVYNQWDEHIIMESLKEIEKGTCIKFVKRQKEENYIFITPMGGCWSYVGRQGGAGPQELSLSRPHCLTAGTVIHEFVHALGMWHEHARSDRDLHVEVLWHNVLNQEKQINFAKTAPEAVNFLYFPYDYQSVMHYDAYAFTKSPKLPTMRPKSSKVKLRDLGRAKTIGTLTETDRLKINTLYECKT